MLKNITALDGVLVDLAGGKAAPPGALPELQAKGYATASGRLTDKGRERARKVKASGVELKALSGGFTGAGRTGLNAVGPKFTT